MTPKNIVSISVFSMWESCERTTYFVRLKTDEGFDMTPASYRTGSVYTNFEGLTKEEARERAMMDAASWGDFLCIPVTPLIETIDGVETEMKPKRTFDSYGMRREMAKRREAGAKRQPRQFLKDARKWCSYLDTRRNPKGNRAKHGFLAVTKPIVFSVAYAIAFTKALFRKDSNEGV
jgi:hypothetical protein